MPKEIIIFCDGSSKGNPGPGGWGAIVATERNVTELGAGTAHTTNNRMELTAAIQALRSCGDMKEKIILHTDSEYVVKGMTQWLAGWQMRGWKTAAKKPVLNRDLWQELADAARGKEISWQHVAGHAGIAGNERCDEIANSFADGDAPTLYSGPRVDYKTSLSLDR